MATTALPAPSSFAVEPAIARCAGFRRPCAGHAWRAGLCRACWLAAFRWAATAEVL